MSAVAEPTPVATLRAGDDVDAVFACSRKDRLTARSGLPYLALELRDRTGAIQGRAFRDADLLSGRFERGEPRAPAAAITPTSAGCSSTRSRLARSRSRPASCIRG